MAEDTTREMELEALLARRKEAPPAKATEWPGGVEGQRLLARAEAALGCAPARLVTFVVKESAGAVEVTTGDGRPGEVVSRAKVRGEARGGVLIKERLGGRSIAAHVEAAGPQVFRVQLDLGVEAASGRTRVTLLRGQREVLSERARQGRVCLPDLGVGRWRVRLEDEACWLGDIDLVLEGPSP